MRIIEKDREGENTTVMKNNEFKGAVHLILNDSPFKEVHARITSVPLKL